MPFSSHNFQNREVLLHILSDLQALVTPFTDGLTQQHERLQQLYDKLNYYDPSLRVCVVGPAGSGKSSLLNAVLGCEVLPTSEPGGGPETCFRLDIRALEQHMQGPAVIGRKDECLAQGTEEVRDWLHLENLQQRDRSLRRAELVRGEAQEHLESLLRGQPPPESEVRRDEADTEPPATLRITPPCFEGGFTELPIVFVDTERGQQPTTTWTAPRTARIRTQRTVFHGDAVVFLIDFRVLRTPAEEHFLDLLFDEAQPHLAPAMQERLVFIVTHADPLINRIHRIDDIHDQDKEGLADRFSDMSELRSHVMGTLKQRVGLISPAQLCVVSSRLALHSRLVQPKSGDRSDASMDAIYNYFEAAFGSHYMQRIDTIPEDQLRSHAAATAVEREQISGIVSCEEALQLLALNSGSMLLSSVCCEATLACQYFHRVLDQAGPLIRDERSVDDAELAQLQSEISFVDSRREQIHKSIIQMRDELEAVIADAFRDFWDVRVGELRGMLDGQGTEHFKARQETALSEVIRNVKRLRTFMTRYEADRRYLEGKIQARESRGPAPSEDHQWDFVEREGRGVLQVLRRELRELVTDIGLSFMHHLKDELQLFLPAVIALCQQRRLECLEQLQQCAADVLQHTAQRTGGEPLDLAVAGADWAAQPLAASDDRTINNFLRDLPVEAAERLLEAAEGDCVRLLEPEECAQQTMQLIASSWSQVLEGKESTEVLTYDRGEVTACLERLQGCIDGAVLGYRESLADGLRQQEEALTESRLQEAEVAEQIEQLQPLLQELQQLWQTLKAGILWDLSAAVALAEEEQVRQSSAVADGAAAPAGEGAAARGSTPPHAP
eukprot:TRINITY_DN12554_c0_g1_i1.p1 TRINITY_DN12554_c0_g1~~TRINITY_DN12554_c0_g1_i1.p1  ORF type:complete len:875 (+),score=348.35 TRINITY_DN12554_c0_g1_i1:108-2627(+)